MSYLEMTDFLEWYTYRIKIETCLTKKEILFCLKNYNIVFFSFSKISSLFGSISFFVGCYVHEGDKKNLYSGLSNSSSNFLQLLCRISNTNYAFSL